MLGPTLETLGWTDARARAFAALAAEGLVPGRVGLEHNHVYRVFTATGEVLAEATGRLKHLATGRHELPVVGDWVAVRLDAAGGRSQIVEILPRLTWFSRKAAGREGRETEEQVVAANIDTVFVVLGLDRVVRPRIIERYLLVARRNGVTPVVVLNKVDLAEDLAAQVADARAVAGDAPVIPTSTKTGEGLPALERYLTAGHTVALLGPSGAGKSSMVNRFVSRELLPTGEVRERDNRGRHTSVHRQLVVREAGGLVIDTPGMRELQVWETDGIDDTFTDIAALADECRFRDCGHETEPGCAVKAAVAAGTLAGERYHGFLKLQAEQRAVRALRETREQSGAKRVGRMAQKTMRAFNKTRGRDTL